jgi:hypothetical protein
MKFRLGGFFTQFRSGFNLKKLIAVIGSLIIGGGIITISLDTDADAAYEPLELKLAKVLIEHHNF